VLGAARRGAAHVTNRRVETASPRALIKCQCTPKKKGRREAGPSRLWRLSIIRRSEFLGHVEAPDKDAATAAAIDQFGISDDEREWMVVRPAHRS
jgi:hypothetical protein